MPDEQSSLKQYRVWVCHGCDICEPLDAPRTDPMPCTETAPSTDGADVVIATELAAAVNALRRAHAYTCADDVIDAVLDLVDLGQGATV